MSGAGAREGCETLAMRLDSPWTTGFTNDTVFRPVEIVTEQDVRA